MGKVTKLILPVRKPGRPPKKEGLLTHVSNLGQQCTAIYDKSTLYIEGQEEGIELSIEQAYKLYLLLDTVFTEKTERR